MKHAAVMTGSPNAEGTWEYSFKPGVARGQHAKSGKPTSFAEDLSENEKLASIIRRMRGDDPEADVAEGRMPQRINAPYHPPADHTINGAVATTGVIQQFFTDVLTGRCPRVLLTGTPGTGKTGNVVGYDGMPG